MARKIKIGDGEREFEDEVAEWVGDDSGVPWKNRAAESRRKLEKAEERARSYEEKVKAYEERLAAAEAQRQQPARAALPYDPSSYQVPAMTQEQIRAAAREEAIRLRDQEAYEREEARLREEWPDYEEHEPELIQILRKYDYPEEAVKGFGPRDKRLMKAVLEAHKKSAKPARARPQEVVLDTGGGDGVLESSGSPWEKANFGDKKKLAEAMAWAKARPPVGEE